MSFDDEDDEDFVLGKTVLDGMAAVLITPTPKPAPQPTKLVEVVRSFSYKMNVGNYESRDFFCSQKVECLDTEAEAASLAAYNFCRQQVHNAVTSYMQEMKAKSSK